MRNNQRHLVNKGGGEIHYEKIKVMIFLMHIYTYVLILPPNKIYAVKEIHTRLKRSLK